jgi:hypothetical protein
MEEKSEIPDARDTGRWPKRLENAKDDPELERQLKAAKRVMETYSETLQRLADS